MVVENLPLSFRFTQMEISTFEASLAAFLVGSLQEDFVCCKRVMLLLVFLQNFHSVRNKEGYVMIKHCGQFAQIAVEFIDTWVCRQDYCTLLDEAGSTLPTIPIDMHGIVS